MAESSSLFTAVVMLAPIAVVVAVRAALSTWHQRRHERALAERAAIQRAYELAAARRDEERAASRRPAPGTIDVEGIVEPESDRELEVVARPQAGCLGGPVVYDVPTFRLRLADGRSVTVDSGPDPDFTNPQRLLPPVIATPEARGRRHYSLKGNLRISGVLFVSDAHLAPPAGHSATLQVV